MEEESRKVKGAEGRKCGNEGWKIRVNARAKPLHHRVWEDVGRKLL